MKSKRVNEIQDEVNMEKLENHNIQSELLKEHWNIIGNTYITLKESLNSYHSKLTSKEDFDSEILFFELYDVALDEWRKNYKQFVLTPFEPKIIELFIKAQTTNFELKKSSERKEKVYLVHYYILQYFSIGILPYHEHKHFPDMGFKISESRNINLLLYKIYRELWSELKLDKETGGDLFEDKSEFYDSEVDFLSTFLSDCWNEAKSQTKLEVVGILIESTGASGTYSLDENKELQDNDKNPH